MSEAEPQWTSLRDLLDRGLRQLQLDPGEEQRDRMIRFLYLLERWNRVFNLTAVRDPAGMVPRHLLDSLVVAPFLGAGAVLDLGTGAGLPGIPLAIMQPAREFVLLDANGKKVRFVRQAALELGLRNLEAVQGRMESYRPGRKFANIVSRAVTSLLDLSAAAEPLVARPGRLLALKGRWPHDELAALGGHSPLVHPVTVPGLDGERHLIEIRYDRASPW